MNKLLGVVVFVFLFNQKVFSAPCYGTHLPKQKGFVFGMQNHIVFKRKLENDYGRLRSMQNFVLVSYGLTDWFSLDLKGGAGYIKQHPLDNREIDYSTGFAGGYGFRIKLYEKKNKKMVLGFQHISVHPKDESIDGIKHQAILDDWQGSFLVSYDILKITPYLGLKYSRIDYIHKQDDQRKRKMSDLTRSWGLVLGIDFNLNEKTYLNLEAQALDSQALAISLNYNF